MHISKNSNIVKCLFFFLLPWIPFSPWPVVPFMRLFCLFQHFFPSQKVLEILKYHFLLLIRMVNHYKKNYQHPKPSVSWSVSDMEWTFFSFFSPKFNTLNRETVILKTWNCMPLEHFSCNQILKSLKWNKIKKKKKKNHKRMFYF